jgi:carbonic anhydrase
MVEANNEKQKHDMQKLVMQAWYTAVWQRTKTVPKLEDVMEDLKDSMEEATDDKIMRKMNKLRNRMGGAK